MLPGCKPDYNASNFAVNARFFELDERIALCIFSTENALQKTTLLLLLSLQRKNDVWKKGHLRCNYQGYWVLRHLHGLLIPGEKSSIIITKANLNFLPGVHWPELLWHEVVHEEPHALNQSKQHPPNNSWSNLMRKMQKSRQNLFSLRRKCSLPCS